MADCKYSVPTAAENNRQACDKQHRKRWPGWAGGSRYPVLFSSAVSGLNQGTDTYEPQHCASTIGIH